MQTTLPKHISKEKQEELKKIVKFIRQQADVEMIILFGSYARGDFVDFDKKTKFRSDYDILVITQSKKYANQAALWLRIEAELIEDDSIKTKPKLIVDHFGFVNKKLKNAKYFYADIYKEGIMLFDSGKFKLKKPKEPAKLPLKVRAKEAREDFESLKRKTERFFENFEFNFEKGKKEMKKYNKQDYYNLAAFNLHQTTENIYTEINLVFSGYKPPIHNLLDLQTECEKKIPEITHFFFDRTQKCNCEKPKRSIFKSQKGLENICIHCNEDARLFVLLAKAYVDSRYDKNFKVNKKDLEVLAKKIQEFKKIVEKNCKEKVKQLEKMAKK